MAVMTLLWIIIMMCCSITVLRIINYNPYYEIRRESSSGVCTPVMTSNISHWSIRDVTICTVKKSISGQWSIVKMNTRNVLWNLNLTIRLRKRFTTATVAARVEFSPKGPDTMNT